MEHRKITFEQLEHEKAWRMSYFLAVMIPFLMFMGAILMSYVATGAL